MKIPGTAQVRPYSLRLYLAARDGGHAENAGAFFGHANESPSLSWQKA
jgi:hypothetical protein